MTFLRFITRDRFSTTDLFIGFLAVRISAAGHFWQALAILVVGLTASSILTGITRDQHTGSIG